MPLFPYLPVIVWMGMINIVLSATSDETQSGNDPANWTNKGASVLPFPRPVTAAVVG
jgi:hypothetical protein